MNTNLTLATSQTFGNVQCDFWADKDNSNDFWMTREQIGTALEYTPDPSNSISVIHRRHKDRLDKFSGVVKLTTPSGTQDCTVYSARGVFEICRWSRQAKADEFMDWVWEIVDGLRTGKYKLYDDDKYVPYAQMINNLNENQSILLQEFKNFQERTDDNILSLAYDLDDVKKETIPKTKAYDNFLYSKGLLSLNGVAKSLKIGRNTMMEILRQNDILLKDGQSTIPYEKFIQAGYFVVDSKVGRDGKVRATTKVTAKGMAFIFNMLYPN